MYVHGENKDKKIYHGNKRSLIIQIYLFFGSKLRSWQKAIYRKREELTWASKYLKVREEELEWIGQRKGKRSILKKKKNLWQQEESWKIYKYVETRKHTPE